MLFDTHAHYDDHAYDPDRDALLREMHENGVELILNPGCSVPSSRMAVELSERHPFVYAAVGIHPEDCAGVTEADYEALRALARERKVVAIGEIGLDYFVEGIASREEQRQAFRRQLSLAQELDLPVIVHDREAHGDTLAIVQEFPALRGEFHCYSGSPEMAEILLKRGWYLGFDGPVTYKNARRAPEVAAVTPLSRILIETDAPYLSPVPHRGQRNRSEYLRQVIQVLSQWKGVSPEELERVTLENGKQFFAIQ